jgi:DNA-binding MarR family transcriptional regulator
MDNELRDSVPLTLAEYDVLFEIEATGGRIRLIELSKLVHLSQSRVSRQIAALEEKGYVTRGNISFDRRATFALITSAGRKVLRKAEGPLRRAWHKHFLHHIPPTRLAMLNELMLGLIAEKGEWQYDEDPALKRGDSSQ